MPATDYQGSSATFVSLGRSLLSLRRDHDHSMDTATSQEHALESFQRRIADLFIDLSSSSDGNDLLSLFWIRKLLDTFLICQEEFRVVVFLSRKAALTRPPLDRLITEYFERAVKALDICNAIRDGIDQIRQLEKQLEIVLFALGPHHRTLSEGQFRRAKKALAEFAIAMLDEKEATGSVFSHRNRSFGRHDNKSISGKDHNNRSRGHSRSLSWSVSRTWSAARQLQAIGNNLTAPRGNEVAATNGLAVPLYMMNSVLLFMMWTLVAAIPCQDRGIQMHFSIPRGFVWAAPILSLYERILEESKKKERKSSNGLLKEMYQIEKCVRHLMEVTDVVQFPLEAEKDSEVREKVQELEEVCNVVKEGLDPLERQVREVFRRIVCNRTEGLDSIAQTSNA